MVIDTARPVRVFRNWKHRCYNIMQGSYVVSAREVELADVEFQVRESGRQRMLRTGRKTVHAYAVGTLVSFARPAESDGDSPPFGLAQLVGRPMTYDALQAGQFLDRESRQPVIIADRAYFDEHGGRYLPASTQDLNRYAEAA